MNTIFDIETEVQFLEIEAIIAQEEFLFFLQKSVEAYYKEQDIKDNLRAERLLYLCRTGKAYDE